MRDLKTETKSEKLRLEFYMHEIIWQFANGKYVYCSLYVVQL